VGIAAELAAKNAAGALLGGLVEQRLELILGGRRLRRCGVVQSGVVR
jgi:hypothetical protein